MTRVLLFLTFLFITPFARILQLNTEKSTSCTYPSPCNFNDPQLWTSQQPGNVVNCTDCTYLIQNADNVILAINERDTTSICKLDIYGNNLVLVEGTFNVWDVSLHDTATLSVQGTFGYDLVCVSFRILIYL